MNANKDSKKVIEGNLKICENNIYSNPIIVRYKAFEGYEIAKKIKDFDKIVEFIYFYGLAEYYLGHLEEAFKYTNIGLRIGIYHDVGGKYMVDIYKVLGLIYKEVGELDRALVSLFKALEIAKKIDLKVAIAKIYNNLSFMYFDFDDLIKAEEFLLKSKEAFGETEDKETEVILNVNIGELYITLGKYKEASKYLFDIYDNKELKDKNLSIVSCIDSIGKLYWAEKKYDKSLEKFNEALKLAIESQSDLYILNTTTNIAELYKEMKNNNKALENYFKALELSIQTSKKAAQEKIYVEIGEIYKEEGDFEKALEYYSKAIQMNETIKKIEKAEKSRFANIQMDAIEVKKENEDLQQINSNLKEINDVCKHITSEFEINKILFKSYENIEKLLQSKDFQLFLYKKETNKLTGFKIIKGKIKFKEYFNTLNKWMMNKKEITILKDLNQSSSEYIKEVTGNNRNAKGLVYIPLLVEQEIIGAICIFDYLDREYAPYTLDVLQVLASYIAVALNNAQNIEKLESINKKLDKASKLDPLTKIANRRYFTMHLDNRWEALIKNKETLSIALLDIDYFKKYNDKCGHIEGDKALIKVAQKLKESINFETDFLARYGGEEFIIASVKRNQNEMKSFAENLRREVEEIPAGCTYHENCCKVTISIGIASEIITKKTRIEDITNKADEALYKAKENGRNRVEEYQKTK